jgi:glycosyltransferase involved in cell wall biosynthesis
MKLIIQIPCINEERTLPAVFKRIPKKIDGIDTIEYQIMDDGSTDKTVEVAKKLGVHHFVTGSPKGKNRRWLGRAFKIGIDNALELGADILVNTDGDNQYPSEYISDLVRPIIEGRAEIVIADRQTSKVKEFSLVKKALQKFGSFVTQILSGEKVPDAVSGFRAYSRKAMQKINVITDYTYTVDTLMQANKKGLDIEWIKIKTNPKTRESRLIKNLWTKIKKSGSTILRMYAIYEPFKTFLLISSLFLISGFVLLARFVYFWLNGDGDGHVQSVTIGAISSVVGVQLFALGIIADLLSVNRRLIEDILERLKKKNITTKN